MYKPVLLLALLTSLLIGCGKSTKLTGSSDTPSSKEQTAHVDKGKPSDKSDKNKKEGDRANWLKDPRGKKENDGERTESGPEAGGLPGKPGLGFTVAPPPGGWAPGTNSVASDSGPSKPASSSAVATKPVSESEMKELWTFVESRSSATGQMPSIVEINSALSAARSRAADLVKDGSIVLTGAKTRESVWAYERKALSEGGWVASQNGVENLTASELDKRLRAR